MDRESKVKETVLHILGRYNNEFKGLTNGLMAIYTNDWWVEVSVPGLATRNYDDFWDFVEADAPFGCEANKEIIEAICKKVDNQKALEMFFPEKYMSGKIGSGRPKKGEEKTDNVSLSYGNSPQYKLNRLKRDHPDLAEKVISGELSPNAAAIEAGLTKKKMTVSLEPDKVVNWIQKYFSDEDIDYIRSNL